MKISVITAMALGGAMLSTAPAAYAGSSMGYHTGSSHSFGQIGATADCPAGTSRSGDGTCLMNSGSSMAGAHYGGSSYSSGSTITTYSSVGATADCPPGSSRSGDGTCMMSSGGSLGMGSTSMGHTSRTYGGTTGGYTPSTSHSSSYSSSSSNCPAGSTRAADGVCMSNTPATSYTGSSSYSYSSSPLNSYQGQSSYVVDNTVTSALSDSEADYRYGSGSISQTYTDGSNTIVPFTTTSATLSNYRVPGMGANEYLSATDCPVNVYNPGGAKVLGCYKVSKPAPVRVSVPNYHTVRVVRPIIYVRYPVPVAVPVHTGWHQTSYQHHNGWGHGGNWGHANGCNGWNSRYGQNWPGRSCGW